MEEEKFGSGHVKYDFRQAGMGGFWVRFMKIVSTSQKFDWIRQFSQKILRISTTCCGFHQYFDLFEDF